MKNRNLLITLALLVSGNGGVLLAQPETTELREPEAIRVVEPIVPYEFSRYNIRGNVEVTFRIDEEGRPDEIVVETATHNEFAKSVKNALRQWRFERPEVPGMKYRLPVVFN
ncbi:MAG: TonB family protein [Oceanipulchritudo sp.]